MREMVPRQPAMGELDRTSLSHSIDTLHIKASRTLARGHRSNSDAHYRSIESMKRRYSVVNSLRPLNAF